MEKDMSIQNTVESLAIAAKKAARKLAFESTTKKNNVLRRMAAALLEQKAFIQAENNIDLAAGREKGLSAAMLDRLALTEGYRVNDRGSGGSGGPAGSGWGNR